MADLRPLIERLEVAVARLEAVSSTSSSSTFTPRTYAATTNAPTSTASGDASISAFDSLVESHVGRVVAAAQKIGGQVLQGTQALQHAFSVEREILLTISKCKQPDIAEFQSLLKPLGEAITKAAALTEGKRTDAYNHLKVVAESLSALTWVAFTGKDCGMSFPATHIEEAWQSAEFYNNKILVEYRNKDANHVEWAKSMKELYLLGLRDYAKKFHVTGPAWNSNGVDYKALDSKVAPLRGKAPPPPPPGAPPPPPPAAGISFSAPNAKSSAGSRQGMDAVFKEISQGEGVTSGLRKVTADMKTKNRADRSGVVSGDSSKGAVDVGNAPVKNKVGPPKFELQMERKWVVENQIGNKNLIVSKCNAWQSVYIFGCQDSVVQIQGKVNNITLDKCLKTGVVFKDVVSAFEIVNCTSVEVQCQGTAPSISVDNSTGCQLYLSKSALDACITTAKSSEINVHVPGENDDADLVEHALAEQFMSVYKDGSFVTMPVSHSGG